MGRRLLISLQLGLLFLALLLAQQEIFSQAAETTPPATAATTATTRSKSGVCALQSTVSVIMVSLYLLLRLHC